jgi:hypothetical protein
MEISSAFLLNVGMLLTTRMQSVDYKFKRSLYQSVKYIVQKDLFKSLFKGYFTTFLGTTVLYTGF